MCKTECDKKAGVQIYCSKCRRKRDSELQAKAEEARKANVAERKKKRDN
jgi:hypothetical protein